MFSLGIMAILLAGVSLGLIGGGGSILTVPILVYFFQIDAVSATGYSLFIVGLAAAIGSIPYARSGSTQIKTGLAFGAPSLIGVSFARAYLLPLAPDPVFSASNILMTKSAFLLTAFAILMISAAVVMFRPSQSWEALPDKIGKRKAGEILLSAALGLFVGLLTGFLGAGGGFLIVPALAVFLKLPMKQAVGTSLFVIAINSLIGFSTEVIQGKPMDWPLLFALAIVSVIGIFIGFQLARNVSGTQLKRGFSFFVLLMGLGILLDQIVDMMGAS